MADSPSLVKAKEVAARPPRRMSRRVVFRINLPSVIKKAARGQSAQTAFAFGFAPSQLPADLIVNRSTPAFPPALFIDPVNDDDRHRRIVVGVRKHLFAVFQVVLRVALLEPDAMFLVPDHRFLTIGTAGFGIDYYLRHRSLLSSVISQFINQFIFD